MASKVVITSIPIVEHMSSNNDTSISPPYKKKKKYEVKTLTINTSTFIMLVYHYFKTRFRQWFKYKTGICTM